MAPTKMLWWGKHPPLYLPPLFSPGSSSAGSSEFSQSRRDRGCDRRAGDLQSDAPAISSSQSRSEYGVPVRRDPLRREAHGTGRPAEPRVAEHPRRRLLDTPQVTPNDTSGRHLARFARPDYAMQPVRTVPNPLSDQSRLRISRRWVLVGEGSSRLERCHMLVRVVTPRRDPGGRRGEERGWLPPPQDLVGAQPPGQVTPNDT